MSNSAEGIASTCKRCGRIYIEGVSGVCSACRQAARRSEGAKRFQKQKRPASLKCQCGRQAVTVLSVCVGREFDGYYTVRMPLCRACLKLEKAMWEEKG